MSALLILLAFLISATLTTLVIPQIILISYKKHLFDSHNARKVHKGDVPRLGGVAFTPAIIISMAMALGFATLYVGFDASSFYPTFGARVAVCLSALMFLYLEGITDDLVGMGYKMKFVIQTFCAASMVSTGIYFDNLYGLFGVYELTPWVGVPLTIVAIIYVINAINLIDGIDGLASGLSCIACFFFGCLYYYMEEYVLSAIAFAALGTLMPFFVFNVFGNVEKMHKIFMGDCGSQTIGFVLGLLAVDFSMKGNHSAVVDENFPNSLVMAFSVIMIPLLDVLRVFFGRIRRHQNPFMPDKTHIHHKFLALGMSHRTAMCIILMLAVFFCLFNLLLVSELNINLLLILDVLVWTLMILWLNCLLNKKKCQMAVSKS